MSEHSDAESHPRERPPPEPKGLARNMSGLSALTTDSTEKDDSVVIYFDRTTSAKSDLFDKFALDESSPGPRSRNKGFVSFGSDEPSNDAKPRRSFKAMNPIDHRHETSDSNLFDPVIIKETPASASASNSSSLSSVKSPKSRARRRRTRFRDDAGGIFESGSHSMLLPEGSARSLVSSAKRRSHSFHAMSDMSEGTHTSMEESSKFKSRRKLDALMHDLEEEKRKDKETIALRGGSTHGRSIALSKSSHHGRSLSFQSHHDPSAVLGEWKKPELTKSASQAGRLRKFRVACGYLVEEPRVQMTIIVLIIVNAIFMGIATFDFVTENEDMEKKFNVIDRIFLSVFTLESTLQLIYRGLFLFTDGWLVFDFVIVVTSWTLESLQVIRAFRIFRAFRLVTRIGALRSLVMALGEVMPRIYAIASMLALVFYIYAVLFTQLFGDLPLSSNYFNTLPNSLFTCMELMTLEWAGVAREVMGHYYWASIPFLSFISLTGFIVFNLIVAVVCDSLSIVDKKLREEEEAFIRELRAQERRELGLDGGEVEDMTLIERWNLAQRRISDLSSEVENMKASQIQLLAAITKLSRALQEKERDV